MTSPSHTPGPWVVTKVVNGHPGYVEEARFGLTICRMQEWDDPEWQAANARLIAAAPDLHKAALFILAYGLDVPVADPKGIVGSVPIVTGRELLEAAIAKATP